MRSKRGLLERTSLFLFEWRGRTLEWMVEHGLLPARTEWRVKRAKRIRDYVVEFTFTDGTKRGIDLEPFLHGGIFEPLRSPEVFKKFKVKYGTIVWPNRADIAPETLYHDLGPVPPEGKVF